MKRRLSLIHILKLKCNGIGFRDLVPRCEVAEDSASEEAVLPALLSESLFPAPPLLSHAARERTSRAESRKDMDFFI